VEHLNAASIGSALVSAYKFTNKLERLSWWRKKFSNINLILYISLASIDARAKKLDEEEKVFKQWHNRAQCSKTFLRL
jgi:hypothetical protein